MSKVRMIMTDSDDEEEDEEDDGHMEDY